MQHRNAIRARRISAAVALALSAGVTTLAFSGTPYSGTAVAVPATIEAENFDKGGEGQGYHDLTSANTGGQYRTAEAVDIVASTDSAGGGYVVNNFQSGEWLAYTINVPAAGAYDIALRVSNNFGSGTPAFHLAVDGVSATSSIPVPKTNSWDTFQWVTATGVNLPAGTHVLRVYADTQYFNLNQVKISGGPAPTTGGTTTGTSGGTTSTSGGTTTSSYAGTPYSGTPVALPKIFEAENFDKGGEGVAYHDLTPTSNSGGQYRTSEGVDISTTTATPLTTGGQYVINNFQKGEWLNYTVNVPADGSYDLSINAANNYSGPGSFHLEVDGVNVTGAVAVGVTGGWDVFQWFGKTGVALKAGKHVIKLVADAQYFNVNALSVLATGTTSGTTGGTTTGGTTTGGTTSGGTTSGGTTSGGTTSGGTTSGGSTTATMPVVGGDVKWVCDFENTRCGMEEQDKIEPLPRSTFTTTSRTGGTAIKLTTQPGDNYVHGSDTWERDDLSLPPSSAYCNPGQEEWWAHSVMFPSDYVLPTYGTVAMDFHDNNGGSNANFHFNSMATGLRLHGFGGNPSSPNEYKVELGPVQRNVWYDMVYHVKWSPNSDGFMVAWMNGKKVLTYNGPTLYSPGVPCYLKLANYHDPLTTSSSIIHDRVVRGATATSVAIGALEGVQ